MLETGEMTWNNRIFKHVDNRPSLGGEIITYAIHETHYGADGKVKGWTTDPMCGHFESVDEMIESLEKMLADVKRSKGDILNYK